MSQTDDFDVVVVGARCAGAATALLLARAGVRVLVLDRTQPGTDTLSTHALMRGGAALLQQWGLLSQIAAAGTPPVRRARFCYGDETVEVSLKPAAGVDALYAPRRTVLDSVLASAAIAAGAQLRYGVEVTGVRRDSAGRVTGVVGRDRTGGELRVRAGLTVGADGARSQVARWVGAETRRTGRGSGAVIYGYWRGLPAVGYEWLYRPGVSAGLIPTNGGEVAVFAGTTADRFRRECVGDLAGGYQRLLKEAAGAGEVGDRLAGAEPPSRLFGFPGRASFLRQAWGPGWALAGDAGYFLDPLSTHGMTDALRDGWLLADAVRAVHRGELTEPEALGNYQWVRDGLSIPLFDTVDAIASYQWDLAAIRQLLRQSSAAMSVELAAISPHKADV